MALGPGGGGTSSSSSNLSPLAPPFTVDRFNPKPVSNPVMMSDMPYTAAAAAAAAVGATPFGHSWQYIQQSEPTRPEMFPKTQLGVDDSTRTTYTPLINDQLSYTLPESANPSNTPWSGLDPVVNIPVSNGFRYSVSESVNPSSTQWSGVDFGCSWEFHLPHSSEARPNVLPRLFDVDDSERATSIPLAGDYGCLASESVNQSGAQWSGLNPDTKSPRYGLYGGEGKPYFPPYVSPVGGNDCALVSPSGPGSDRFSASGIGDVCSRFDSANRSSGLEFVPQWRGFWNGLAETKQGKQVESRGFFSSDQGSEVAPAVNKNYAGQGVVAESGIVSTVDPGKLFGKSTDGIQREILTGSFNVKNGDDRSFFAQEVGSGFFYGKSAGSIGKEGSTGSFGMGNVNDESLNTQKLGFLPFESLGTQFLGSSSRLSESGVPDPFQKPSKSIFNHQKKYGPHETLIQPLDSVVQDSAPSMKPSSRAVIIRAPVGGISSAKDLVTHKAVTSGNATNVSRKMLESPKSMKTEESHILRHQSIEGSLNPKLDNGCEFSSKGRHEDYLDIASNRGTASHVTDKHIPSGLSLSLDHVQPFQLTENPSDSLDNHNPAVDSPCWRGAPAPHYSSLDIVNTSSPRHLSEKLDAFYDMDANGNQIVPRATDSKRAALQIPSEGNIQNKIGSTDDGFIAYHAAEDVLHSPSGEENSVDRHQCSGTEGTVRMDVPMLINAIGNLAELLRVNCSTDSCGLKEHDKNDLKHAISNLNACISEKVVASRPSQESMFSQQHNSPKTGELDDVHVGKHDHQYMDTEKINLTEAGKKADNSPYTSPMVDHMHSSNDENIVQAIKQVLDVNFDYEEGIEPETMLFKNLWLETEAKLCSISYKARFDHMRIQMDKYESNRKRGDAGKATGCGGVLDQKAISILASQAKDGSALKGTVADHPTFSTKQCQKALSLVADDIDASVLDSLDILKGRHENSDVEEWQQKHLVDPIKSGKGNMCSSDDVEANVLARLHILRQREMADMEEQQQPETVNTVKAGRSGASLCDFVLEHTTNNTQSTSRNSHVDDEALVLARFNTLRRRDEKSNPEEKQQLDMVDTEAGGFDSEGLISDRCTFIRNSDADDEVEPSVLARFNILKTRDDKSIGGKQQTDTTADVKNAGGQYESYSSFSGYESMKDSCVSVAKDPPVGNASSGYQLLPGWYNASPSSSDWEHVGKDDFAWLKW